MRSDSEAGSDVDAEMVDGDKSDEGSSTAQGGTPTCTTPGSASWNPCVVQLPSRRVERCPTSAIDVSRRVGQLWFLTENTPTPSLVMKTRVSRLLREAKILLKAPLRGEDSAARCARAFFIRRDQATWRCWSVWSRPPLRGGTSRRTLVPAEHDQRAC